MIGYLTGKIVVKKPTHIILDVNGVGYRVRITLNTYENLPDIGQTASIHTHLVVKEDALDLYGFFNPSEKEMFELLIGINGVGPKSAQGILSGIQIEDLAEAVRIGNLNRIVAIPGIGKKTGERLIIELRDKVNSISRDESEIDSGKFDVMNDSVSALVSLGYNVKVAEKCVRTIISENPSLPLEDVIKETLSIMHK